MRVTVVWWDLSRSAQTIASLRAFLRDEAVDRFAQVPGLRLKLWISDEDNNRWGAVMVWESARAAAAPLPTRAAELIGYPPTLRNEFDVEATTEGIYETVRLAGLGRALTE